ncbi:MAG: hypothetical protein IT440_13590 [Phycisphaeraceae bacterium]|nr:hypothetical protein [Phycisphaeraceae bacterium]
MALLTLKQRDQARQWLLCAKQWDQQRHELAANRAIDPALQLRTLSNMIEQVLARHGGMLRDDDREDQAEIRLAQTLSQRTTDSPRRQGAR